MKNILNLVTFALLSLSAIPVLAAQMHLEARIYSSTDCTYFSNTLGDFKIQYYNPGLPDRSYVEIIYGFNDANIERSNWIDPKTVALDSSHDKGMFQKIVTANVNSRGGRRASAIQFVLKVTLPNGEVFFEKGSSSRLGYYDAQFGSLPMGCRQDDQPFRGILIYPVEKN